VLTYAEAKAAMAAAVSDQDSIRENLLDLDRSFGKRLLAGANLAGDSKRRWDTAAGELNALWQLFAGYSAVVDRAAELTGRGRKPGPRLAEVTELLTGKSVQLADMWPPGARRELTGSGTRLLTVAESVEEMKRCYTDVAEVVNAAETVWNEAADRLQQAQAELGEATRQADGFEDAELKAAIQGVEQDLGDLRALLNSDPLSLWRDGKVEVSRFDLLRQQTAEVVARTRDLSRVRDDADGRISAAAAAVKAAGDAREDAVAAWQQSAAKIALNTPPGLPDISGLADRLATLAKLKAAGRWARLSAELHVIEQQAAAVAEQCRESEREAAALLARRDELRGLLDAYRARSAKLGAAENRDLEERHERARKLLWSAPCDLSQAADAVTSFQQAVLAIAEQERRQ
jgi:chromosome segregation ATPase